MHIKATLKFHLTPVRMTTIKLKKMRSSRDDSWINTHTHCSFKRAKFSSQTPMLSSWQPPPTTALGDPTPSLASLGTSNQGVHTIIKNPWNLKKDSKCHWGCKERTRIYIWRQYPTVRATTLFRIPQETLAHPSLLHLFSKHPGNRISPDIIHFQSKR